MHLIGGLARTLAGRLPRAGEESGFAMATVIMGVFLTTLIAVTAVSAVNGDIRLTSRNLDEKRAFEAAQAGVADYSFHLNNDNGYWARCTNVPAPNAVNQEGSTAKRRAVPGDTGATYALELIARTGRSPRTCSTSDPVGSMIEVSGPATGTFRIRSTGYAGGVDRSIVATFKRASFLDYVYFTQLETSDPATYGYTGSALAGATSQCSKTLQAGRYNAPIPNAGDDYCDYIVFASGERIDGPFHTNDAAVICGTPVFGRSPSDLIEFSATEPGWYAAPNCSNNQPTFSGTKLAGAPVLTPPPTNGQLKTVSGALKFTGQVSIVLSGGSMTVKSGSTTVYSGAVPTSGVVYVSNNSCTTGGSAYSPFTAKYPATSTCGNVMVRGNYTSQLTIAAENDIIIDGNLCRTTNTTTCNAPNGNGMLGLIANNFIRVKHPVCPNDNLGCSSGTISSQTSKSSCNSGVNGTGAQSNPRIDAAMLSIQHSFIVDHYNCGATLGTLQVNGAISQKFRGPVGIVGNNGYSKDYNYDDRLRYLAPPHFLDPVESAWHMQRQTLAE